MENNKSASGGMGAMKILVQGDSHVRYFRQAFNYSERLRHHKVYFQEIGGATATGLDNPNSKYLNRKKTTIII